MQQIYLVFLAFLGFLLLISPLLPYINSIALEDTAFLTVWEVPAIANATKTADLYFRYITEFVVKTNFTEKDQTICKISVAS